MTKTSSWSRSIADSHGLYQKYLVRSTRYKAHDEKNEARTVTGYAWSSPDLSAATSAGCSRR